jgi:hypothetical protein
MRGRRRRVGHTRRRRQIYYAAITRPLNSTAYGLVVYGLGRVTDGPPKPLHSRLGSAPGNPGRSSTSHLYVGDPVSPGW